MQESDVRLRSVDGIRTLAMIWIVAFHGFFLLGYVMDPRQAWAFFVRPQNNLILQGPFGLDALFVLSGFLIGGYVFRALRAENFSLRTFFVRRAARLFPAYIVALGLYLIFIPLNRGSFWANLLLVNNYIPVAHQTMAWTWTNAIEGQFYILFPFAMLLAGKQRWYLPVLVTALLASMIVSAFVIVKYDITFGFPSPFADTAAYNRLFDIYYDKTPQRIGAIICGLIAAHSYVFGTLRGFFTNRPRLAFAFFLCALALLAGIVSVPWYEASTQTRFGSALSSAYLSFDRVFFSAAVAYVLLFALSGTALSRPVSALLGARMWYWPAELSYGVYLVHPMIIIAMYTYVFHPANMTLMKAFTYEAVVIPLSYLFSLGLYLSIERPIRRLARLYTRKAAELSESSSSA